MTGTAPRAGLAARIGARTCLGVVAVAAVFSLTVFFLLAASFVQSHRADPLESQGLKALRDEIRRPQGRPELREEYRRLDLLARRAYFDAVAFRRTGAWLLLAGLVVLVSALKLRSVFIPPSLGAPAPGPAAPAGALSMARWLVVSVGVGAAGTLIFLALRFPPPGREVAEISAPAPGRPASSVKQERPAPAPEPQAAAAPQARVAEEGADQRGADRSRQWPGFRGPDGGARAGGDRYPVEWDGASGRNILWRSQLGKPGFNSPVVWGDRVFLTGADETGREVYCLDARDGRLLWRHEVSGIGDPSEAPPAVTPDTGHAASTAATDGLRVFALFSTGDLVAVDFDGRRVWGVNLGVPDNPYGHASSPLVWRDRVIVQYDHRLQARVLALDAVTGRTIWERFRESDVTWSSPILVERGGREELVLSGNPAVAGYDPETGDELWSVPCLSGEVAVSPAHEAGTVFAANEHARLAAIDLSGNPRIAWEHGADLPEVSSPLAAGGLLFMANGAGVVTCLDAKRGAVRWRHEFDTGFYASPVLAGGLVHLLDRSGVMRIFEPAGEYRPRPSPALGLASTVTPAFAAGRIYLRGEREVVCVGAPVPAGKSR